MTIFEAITERYSYRGAYKNAPVPKEDLQKILAAGLAAPSGNDLQTAYLIGVDEEYLLKAAAGILGWKTLLSAPAGICVATYNFQAYRSTAYNIQDYSAAIENMLLAIVGLGYASCWIEGEIIAFPDQQKAFSKLLNIPREFTVVAWLPIGIPIKQGYRVTHKPFEERAFFNQFGRQ